MKALQDALLDFLAQTNVGDTMAVGEGTLTHNSDDTVMYVGPEGVFIINPFTYDLSEVARALPNLAAAWSEMTGYINPQGNKTAAAILDNDSGAYIDPRTGNMYDPNGNKIGTKPGSTGKKGSTPGSNPGGGGTGPGSTGNGGNNPGGGTDGTGNGSTGNGGNTPGGSGTGTGSGPGSTGNGGNNPGGGTDGTGNGSTGNGGNNGNTGNRTPTTTGGSNSGATERGNTSTSGCYAVRNRLTGQSRCE
jgi:hypothetical protein